MTCPFCNDKNQYGDPCSPNQFCTACEAKVVDGKITSRGNGGIKKSEQNAEGFNVFKALSQDLARIDQEIAEKRDRKIEKQEKLRLQKTA